MSRVAEIQHSVEDYRSTELITGALQDISATKMQFIRKDFEENARFFAGIREVYGIVKAHAQEASVVAEENPSHRTRDIYIALTSNKRFYGTLNRDIVRALVRVMETASGSDFLIIGQTGAQYLDTIGFRGKVTRTEFNDDTPAPHELQSILALIDSYARVFLIYPKFVNTFRQDIAMTDITQTPESSVAPEMKAEYIFEPEIPKMLLFFEAQVRRALFERIMLETELARAAARALRMREAKDRADDLLKHSERELRHELATLADLALMETFIGFNFWK
jgi:ATP synthase F1 gamma subunit